MVLYKHNRCICFVNLAVRASDLSFKEIQHCVFSFKCQMVWFGDGLEILNMTHDGVSCSAVSHSGWLYWSNSVFVCATDLADTQRSQTAEARREPLFPSSGSVVPMGLMFLRQSRPSYDQQDLQNIMRAQVTQCQQELSLDQFLSLNMMNMLHSWPVWVCSCSAERSSREKVTLFNIHLFKCIALNKT